MSNDRRGGRGPADHREGVTDLDHLTPVWCRVPEQLVDDVAARASDAGITVDQFVSLALTVTLPGIIAESLRRNVVRDGKASTWPGPRMPRDDLGRPVPVDTTDSEVGVAS